MELRDRGVLITGAKRIGACLALELARQGAHVALSYCTSRAEAMSTVEAVERLGRRATAIHTDVRDPDACRALVHQAAEAFGRLDVLVVMASVYSKTPFDALTRADWETNMSVDLSGSFHCAHAAAAHMRARRTGRIIFFVDSEADCGRPRHTGYLPYFVAKSGVIALSKALALELAADNILVNAVALGPILPSDGSSAEENDLTARATPVGRWGGPLEVAKAVVSLVESEFITGEVIRIDGGRHLA